MISRIIKVEVGYQPHHPLSAGCKSAGCHEMCNLVPLIDIKAFPHSLLLCHLDSYRNNINLPFLNFLVGIFFRFVGESLLRRCSR